MKKEREEYYYWPASRTIHRHQHVCPTSMYAPPMNSRGRICRDNQKVSLAATIRFGKQVHIGAFLFPVPSVVVMYTTYIHAYIPRYFYSIPGAWGKKSLPGRNNHETFFGLPRMLLDCNHARRTGCFRVLAAFWKKYCDYAF